MALPNLASETIVKRIGLFGGSFNPVHLGHLLVAEIVREACALDKIVFIPAKKNPFKKDSEIAEAHHRLTMLELAIRGNPSFTVDTCELDRDKVSYTIDTLRVLRQTYSPDEYQLFFLVGADNLTGFPGWKDAEQLVTLCDFIAFGRPGYDSHITEHPLTAGFHFVQTPLMEISATEIRARIKAGKSIKYSLPEVVENYIYENGIYLPEDANKQGGESEADTDDGSRK